MMSNFNAAEVFDIAIKIEENGKRFYDRSREIIKDTEEVPEAFCKLPGGDQAQGEVHRPQESASCNHHSRWRL